MKNLKTFKYMMVACILAFSAGCTDLLEEPNPDTSVAPEQVLTTEVGVNTLRSAFYNGLRASFNYTTEYLVGPSAIADETRGRPGSSRFQALNTLTGTDGGTNGLDSYGTTYSLILDANLMINVVEDGVIDQSTLDRYRGEAYAIRAFAMHHLVRVLGYEPGMSPNSGPGAGFDLGIVLITTATQAIEDVGPVPRSTVSEVYNLILDDLSQAKSLLAGTSNTGSGNEFISEAFVDGMIARVNLYAGNWSDASEAAQNAIDNSGRELSDSESGVGSMFNENIGGHPEALFKVVVNPSTEPIAGDATNDGLAAYTAEQWSAQLPTNFVIDLYEEDDYRLGWYAPCFDDFNREKPTGCDTVNDEGWELQKFNGEKGQLADDIPYMRLSEMYLIKAEADAKASGSPAAGIEPLLTLRQARNASDISAGDFTSMEDFEDFILEERVRELVSEGHRWFDLKRLGRNIPNPDGSIKVRYDSYRILDDIGAGNISSNPELVENPGY